MQIGIIGGGSVGLLMGSYLSNTNEVTIYVRREEQKIKINETGLIRDGQPFSVKAAMIHEIQKKDLLMIAVKQHHLENVLPFIKKNNAHTPLFFLQNGMGHLKTIQNLKQPIFLGVVEHGALRLKDHKVKHTGKGITKLAPWKGADQLLNRLVRQIHQEDFPFEVNDDWEKLLKEKLIINAVINPITALLNVKNGEILQNEPMKDLARKLCKEAAEVLHLNPEEQWERVLFIAESTRENISSMLNDLRLKRKTEIEAITGYLLEQKKEEHFIPYTTFIYQSIKALETRDL